MKIGIDFDNTIAKYDELFIEIALCENLPLKGWYGGGKTDLREHLCKQGRETEWMKLQGLVYGKYMHRAKMMPGVAKFLLSCKARDYPICIVSHKTEYGHFDRENISLRAEALKWMAGNRFFDVDGFGIKQDHVFFADSREEKVAIIASLECEWFIDDLPAVFESGEFPAKTKKLLFGQPENIEPSSDALIANNWPGILEKVLGSIEENDIKEWSRYILKEPISKCSELLGGGNSRVYKLETVNGYSYALKRYPEVAFDGRARLDTEYKSIQTLTDNGITDVPKAIARDSDLEVGLYEWIDGQPIKTVSQCELEKAIAFIKTLHGLSQSVERSMFSLACEACLSLSELESQIEERFAKLKGAALEFPELARFLENTFEPLWHETRKWSQDCWPIEDKLGMLASRKQTLSPSDFGFHNSVMKSSGEIVFIDFEYFGWDDPVKLGADFIWHPAMNLDEEEQRTWIGTLGEIFSEDATFWNRLEAAFPLFGLRWSMIVLNEFLPGFLDGRRMANQGRRDDLESFLSDQLNKAYRYCERVNQPGGERSSFVRQCQGRA